MADAEQQFMETAEENGYEGGENGAEGYEGGESAELQAGDGENNGAGDGTQDGDGGRIEASKSEEDAGYVTRLHRHVESYCFYTPEFFFPRRLLFAPCVYRSNGGRALAHCTRQRIDSSLL